MRLAQLLFKPKWQDKDAIVRRAAVASGHEPELIEAMPRLVREDPDAGVRLAALKRLNDYENWRERSTGDTDKIVRDSARGAYIALLCGGGDAPTLQRRIAELETLSNDEIERVATTAKDRNLRAAALVYVTKPSMFAERAISDSDPQLRLAALERVTDINLLERIAERARKTDKNVSRRARERLESLRISSGNVAAISDKARVLCDRAESLMRKPSVESESELAALDAQWKELGPAIPDDIAARYRGAHALVLKAWDFLRNPQVTMVVETSIESPAEPPTPPPDEAISQLALAEALASQARFDAALAAVQTEARIEREQREALRLDIEHRLAEFSAAVDSGELVDAHRLYTRIETDVKSLGDVPSSLQRKLAPLQSRHAEMKRWQHWSNNQRRKVLCANVEALIGSGMHPDALATRVREAREEWQRMDTAEGVSTDVESAQGLSRRFHAICGQALRPTKGYFSKRKEVRKSHEEEIAGLLTRADAITEENIDWKAIVSLRTETSAALRSLDSVDPRARTVLAKRLKDAISRLHTLTTAHEREIEESRQRLIQQATVLANRDDQIAAAREVRDLQKRWTAIGNGRRPTDQRQWREFRSACDAVFGKLDEARKERETQAISARAQVQQIVDEFETLAAKDTETADLMKAKLRDLDARWQSTGSDDRVLMQRQREARDAISARLKEVARRQRLSRYINAMQKYTLLRSKESGSNVSPEQWNAVEATDAAFDASLNERFERLRSNENEHSENEHSESKSVREMLVRLEFLAELDSPSEDRQERMNHQVQRLSSRMRGGASATLESEVEEIFATWFKQEQQPRELESRFERAAKAVIDSLP
jgi:DNA repair protein SbcC/Rad50